MDEPKRTLAYLCPKCRQSVAVERSEFQLSAAPNRIPCPCGGSALLVELEADRATLTVPCLYCGREHHVRCSVHDLFHRRALAFSCKVTGLDCCYVGEEEAVFQALRRLEESVAQIEEKGEDDGVFLNDAVMSEVLGELKDIAGRGGISCACGAKEYKIKVLYSAVELTCAACGAKRRIPAATGEDLEDLCCQAELRIGGRET